MRKSLNTSQHKILLEQLHQLRVATGLTQIELAKRLDVPQSFVSKYESGERRLDIIELKAICDALNISLLEFVNHLEVRFSESE